jgi:flavin reductase (DIM6/NTAB) family NADH-FMN oxidoreductase RutF
MMHYTNGQIAQMEKLKRTAFVNSLSGFKSLNMIGTKSNSRQTNLSIINSVCHIGANPPLMGFISRPNSVERHTLENILETNYYSINHVNQNIFKKAHQTSARYARHQSEFDETGLTPIYKNSFSAPFVEESSIQMGLELKELLPIKTNDTLLIIGEILHVYFPDDVLQEDGVLDIEKAGTVVGSSLDGYHTTQLINRLKYAKP